MPSHKTDLVRRSLFGTGGAMPASEQPDGPDASAPRQSAYETARPRRTQVPRVPATAPEVAPTSPARRRVERTAVTIPSDLLMRIKDAVAVLNAWPHQYTMARFVQEAFASQLERLKVEDSGGREFPETNRKIRTGRPPGG
jgi:hypothetical protein